MPRSVFFPGLLHPLLENRFITPGGKMVTAYLISQKHFGQILCVSSSVSSETTKRKLSKISTQKTYTDSYAYHSFLKYEKTFSPLLRSPPLWHREELLAGRSSYHKNNTFLKKNKIVNWEPIRAEIIRENISDYF